MMMMMIIMIIIMFNDFSYTNCYMGPVRCKVSRVLADMNQFLMRKEMG